MILNIQLFGGRGQSSNLKKIPKNKQKSINSYKKRIQEHQDKIQKALNGEKGYYKQTIEHWQKEIKAFENNIDKIERKYKK